MESSSHTWAVLRHSSSLSLSFFFFFSSGSMCCSVLSVESKTCLYRPLKGQRSWFIFFFLKQFPLWHQLLIYRIWPIYGVYYDSLLYYILKCNMNWDYGRIEAREFSMSSGIFLAYPNPYLSNLKMISSLLNKFPH